MARKTTAEQRAEYVARQKSFDPKVGQDTYVIDLIHFTNYHNKNTDSRHFRRWAIDYQTRRNAKLSAALERATDFELRSIGLMSRLVTGDHFISLDHLHKLDNDIDRLIDKYQNRKVEKKVEVVQKPVVADKTDQLVSSLVAEVNAAIDDFATKGTDFSMKGFLAGNNVPGAIAKQIGLKFKKLEAELQEAVMGKDLQLKEAYAHMGKVKLKRFYALAQQIVVDCAQQVVTAKIRKPRVKKEKPASVVASKMKYMKQHDELKLVSEKPEKIIGSDTVWVYDTERRRIFVYVAEDGQKLGVRGTTITGFDIQNSGVKTLRKPESFLTGSMAKRTIMTSFKELKTKAGVPNGRTNEQMIILKVF